MSISARLITFIMCHVGLFATIFLLASGQPSVSDADPAALALEKAAAGGTVVMAGDLR